jgi:hypothetical protein
LSGVLLLQFDFRYGSGYGGPSLIQNSLHWDHAIGVRRVKNVLEQVGVSPASGKAR